MTQTEIKFSEKNMIIGLSASDAGRLQGHHSAHLLVIVDEASAIDPSFWPAIQGVLASGDSRLLLLGNPVVSADFFYDCFGRNRAQWRTFSINAFDGPNLKGVSLAQLLAMSDQELDSNVRPYLTSRRWVKDRYSEWFNGTAENSPLWQSRVLGEFPSASTNALIPLSALEAARRPAVDSHGAVTIGIDIAGPGKDRTVAIACCGSAILETGIWTGDSYGPIVTFIRKWANRAKAVNVDSTGIGWGIVQRLFAERLGVRIQGLNAASSATDKDRFTNLKSERLWFLRERFVKDRNVSGITDDMLAELAAINYIIDAHGKTAIEAKTSVKSALGKSPDLADALALAIGEPAPEPFVYTRIPEPGLTLNQYYRGGGLPNQPPAGWGSQAWKDHLEDLANDLTALMRRRSRAAGFSGFVKGKIY